VAGMLLYVLIVIDFRTAGRRMKGELAAA
jgi:hypothetical protein